MVRWWFLPWTTERIWLTIVLLSLPKWLNPLLCRQQQQRSNDKQDFFLWDFFYLKSSGSVLDESSFLLMRYVILYGITQWKRTWIPWSRLLLKTKASALMLHEYRVHRPWCYIEARSLMMLLRGPLFTFSERCSIEWEYRKLIHWDRSSHSPRDVRASGSIGKWPLAIEEKDNRYNLIGWIMRYHFRF